MRSKSRFAFFLIVLLCCPPVHSGQTPAKQDAPTNGHARRTLALSQAVMCEKIQDYVPQNPAIVFPVALEKVSCFTAFDPVPEKCVIYHNWFHRDTLSTRIKLSLQPPRWSTFSSIQLREADKGPWYVEITDEGGRVFRVLRFSITD